MRDVLAGLSIVNNGGNKVACGGRWVVLCD